MDANLRRHPYQGCATPTDHWPFRQSFPFCPLMGGLAGLPSPLAASLRAASNREDSLRPAAVPTMLAER
jgi:hypothetical protein